MPDAVLPVYRAVVVGCGRIGSSFAAAAQAQPGVYSHAQGYVVHPRIELAGLSDADPERLQEASAHWQVDGVVDYLTLCRNVQPDIVSICTPDETHFPIAMRLLDHAPPRLLFMEKPLTLRVSDAHALLRAATERGCAIAVNYSRRFSYAFRAIREELAQGDHGRPLLIRMLYGKGLFHNGSHAIDLLRYWLGEPETVAGAPVAWGPGDDATWSVDLTFAGGCRARLEAFDERVATVFEGEILCERSRIAFTMGGNAWQFFSVGPSPLYAGYVNYLPSDRAERDTRFAQPMAACLGVAIQNIVQHLDGQEPLACTGEDGLAVLEIIERLRGVR